jgi:N-acetylmuramoyl-L-alanine amidase CwlA
MKIIDRRKQAMGGSSKRSTSQIKNISVHYSATTDGDTASFERYWKDTHGWNTGGYHEAILTNGNIELNYDANVISNGVGGQNTRMYNICYVGAGNPNAKQLKALKERVNYNRKRFNISVSNIKGHREFSGQSTACPSLDMNGFRKSLDNTNPIQPTSTPSKPKPNTGAYKGSSIVDYLNSLGIDSSPANRKKLAKEYGVSNYDTSASKNTELLNKMRHGKPITNPSTVSGRIESKVNGLRFYNKPSWEDKDVIGHVDKGYGFPTILSKHKVGIGYQYKVKNSKGKVFYITAASKYVRVV